MTAIRFALNAMQCLQRTSSEAPPMSINELLELHNLSQTDLSKRFGIPLRTVQNWAEGKNSPSGWVVNLIASALKAPENQ